MLRTDLALEAKEMYEESADDITKISGVKATTVKEESISVTTVEITDEQGSSVLEKPIGTYITIEIEKFRENSVFIAKELSDCFCKQLLTLVKEKEPEVLVVGLGNRDIISDAIGPLVTENLIVTKHLLKYTSSKFEDLFGSLSSLKTGVMAQTGMESFEIIQGVVKATRPDVVIVIDSLVSRQTYRVASSIQITDTGICPGSGVGNHRKEISQRTLNVPVIAVGVPMVVDVATIAYDTFKLLKGEESFEKISKAVTDNWGKMLVAPKDTDELTQKFAKIVANGINLAFHKIEYDEIAGYTA